jgi:hypothetical protein|tara:strand:- start:40 stop:507 length:468 start_codon:yes stop_codon:yes gene_type:complete
MKIKDGHTDVLSTIRMCNNIIEDCQNILSVLPEDEMASLPTWWTNKMAVSGAYINSCRDYLVYTMQSAQEAPKSPTEMLVTSGEEDAVEKREKPENDIKEHQGVDEEAFTFEIKSDSYNFEETGNIEEGSLTQTSGSNSIEISGETTSETEEIKF